MNFSEDASHSSSLPGSPPDLTGSKSSKTSSYQSSYQSDENSILEDVGHFEDIGLDDESRAEPDVEFTPKTPNPYVASYVTELRSTAKQRNRVPMSATQGNRSQRDLTTRKSSRPSYPNLRGQIRSNTTDGLGLVPIHNSSLPGRGLMSPSSPSFPVGKRNRSSSPNVPMSPRDHLTVNSLKLRRASSQSGRERKTAAQLELECDEDDGDDVPDDCFLENVPISPRPAYERAKSRSRPTSTTVSPERQPKEKTRPLGNGTSPKPAEQGELRSPRLQRGATVPSPSQDGFLPKARAKSWTAAMSELSTEAKALTEALEAHAEDLENMTPEERRNLQGDAPRSKARVKSSMAELPPLRRTDIMIDPLPISKEKEAVLSRTRPSWLPPKDPAEEKRHLKEYQKMMASSQEADRKRLSDQQQKSSCRDDAASSLLKIWEEHVLPNFDQVRQQKRTRELWWKGVAPRSRGAVWTKAIGNELGLTDSSYTAALRRSQSLENTIKKGSQLSAEEERKQVWLSEIETDVASTYADLKIFQPDGPLHSSLLDVLKAYAMYRSDVGYVHGTSSIAALLLLNLPTPTDTFIALSNILNRPLPLSFHTLDPGGISRTYTLFESTLAHKSSRLAAHLASLSLQPGAYVQPLFVSLFTSSLSLDNATRLWDVLVFEGDTILVRAGVAYLTALEGKLFGASSADEVRDIVQSGLELGENEWMTCVREAGKS